ncbi:Quinonprotein alcohol dehydrogenase-like-superfamily [Artemisia annua]|uniref:Quinonprotein alcohol dehydrogenase-like-superfamily n=1 Tax=Artemisia annua TaxID=35608 RepID=A0A2U1N7C9_ARTAN|nr:Quinonprotein alcohol dehydrogenase-like-superfamily [Artemisia annua]
MEQNITALCDIDPMLDDIKILLARCISIWKSYPKGKPNEVWSLDMILQDPQGNRVQATVRTKEHINNVGNYHFVFEKFTSSVSWFSNLTYFYQLFSCGTSKEGEAHLVEWNVNERAIKKKYSGFRKRSMGVVQFDTTRKRFLAAGDEFQIMFWDMDSTNLLSVTDAND